VRGGRALRVGPGSLRGLEWLGRVGPSGVEAWAAALGWSRQTAFSHARRLEDVGWVTRCPTVRGDGSLVVITRRGVCQTGLEVAAPRTPAPTWWAHLHACAWAAAWLTARGRAMQGPREVAVDDSWTGELRWRDARGQRKAHHRPDLAWLVEGQRVAVEVELQRKSTPRLEAILALHQRWRSSGHTGGVIYICGDHEIRDRTVRVAAAHDLKTGPGGGLRVETLELIEQQACQASSCLDG
jgi:hypothetical protein